MYATVAAGSAKRLRGGIDLPRNEQEYWRWFRTEEQARACMEGRRGDGRQRGVTFKKPDQDRAASLVVINTSQRRPASRVLHQLRPLQPSSPPYLPIHVNAAGCCQPGSEYDHHQRSSTWRTASRTSPPPGRRRPTPRYPTRTAVSSACHQLEQHGGPPRKRRRPLRPGAAGGGDSRPAGGSRGGPPRHPQHDADEVHARPSPLPDQLLTDR